MSRIFRHIKDGFLGVFRHFALSFSSISSVTITLVLMAVFMLLSQNINQITKQIEQNVALFTQIEKGTDQERIAEMLNEVSSITGVHEATFSSKDDELEYFIEMYGPEGETLYGGFRGKDNPMLDAIIVNIRPGANIEKISQEVETLDNIYKVSYGGDTTQKFLVWLESVRDIGFIFVLVLGGIAIFLIANTINATVHSRQEEISIMRTVGATNWYIRWPFIIEGMLIGLLGAVIPILVSTVGYTFFYQEQSVNFTNMFALVHPDSVIWKVAGVIVLVGVSVGAVGSLFTVSRRLRWTR